MFAKLVGLDLEDINNRYKEVYVDRSEANKEVKRLRSAVVKKPIPVDEPDIDALRKEKYDIEEYNGIISIEWEKLNRKHLEDIMDFNSEQDNIKKDKLRFGELRDGLKKLMGSDIGKFIDYDGIDKEYSEMKKHNDPKPIEGLDFPNYNSTIDIDNKIEAANQQQRSYDNYERDFKEYNNWIKSGLEAVNMADNLNEELEKIQGEKLKIISDAKIPKEFNFTEDGGITYKGLPLSDAQLSSSAKYIAALKLGYMALGSLKTMHFDASVLDKNSLAEIQEWANDNELQLLIERPDFDGGEIKYNLLLN